MNRGERGVPRCALVRQALERGTESGRSGACQSREANAAACTAARRPARVAPIVEAEAP